MILNYHSDDFGYKRIADKKIIRLLLEQKIRGVSVMSNMISSHSLNDLRIIQTSKRNINVGCHINLVEGKSIANKQQINTLVDRNRNFYSLPFFIFKLITSLVDKKEIEEEIKEQLLNLKKNGLKITVLDSHQHSHALSPIAEIVQKVAIEEKIAQVRSYKRVKNFTFVSTLKYFLLKLAAFVSYLIVYKKIGLPVSWRNGSISYSFMSWEGKSFNSVLSDNEQLIQVIHPFLPFDSNKTYQKCITR